MKYNRKCPRCHKRATKRIGKLDFCDNCYKAVRRNRGRYVVGEKYIGEITGGLKVYTDYLISIY